MPSRQMRERRCCLLIATLYGDGVMSAKSAHHRAEMWGLMNDWLKASPSRIPDLDSLHGVRLRDLREIPLSESAT